MDSSSPTQQHHDTDDDHESGDTMSDEEFETPTHEPSAAMKGGKKKRKNKFGSRKAKKARKTRSKVWKHFTRMKNEEDRCTCNYCGISRSCKSSSGTSNLKAHIESCMQYKSQNSQNAGKQQIITPKGGSVKYGMVSEEIWREATNEMMVLAELPFSFVEGLGWRHFCNKVQSYRPHSRRTSTRDIVEILVTRKEAMKKVFAEKKQRVSLTTDIWVAPTTASSYMAITTHFIDSDWKLKKILLGFKNVDDHTGSTIASCLLECLADWGIEKVFTITVDNATANTNAISKFTEDFKSIGDHALILDGSNLHMRCAAHIINLVVKDGLHDAQKSVCSVRNAVHYVRASTNRLKAFDDKLDTVKVTRGSLPLDVSTRWNSTYLMLTRALKFRAGFERMEYEDKRYNDYFLRAGKDGKPREGPPLKKDWEEIERLVKFLVVFYHSTLTVSASTKVNAHLCYKEIVDIQRNLINLSKQSGRELKESSRRMMDKFDKYWGGLSEVNKLLMIATVLDPRKKSQYVVVCFEQIHGKDSVTGKGLRESLKVLMESMFDEYSILFAHKVASGSQSQSIGSSSHASKSSQSQSGQQDQIDDEFGGYDDSMDTIFLDLINAKGSQDASNELSMYLKESVESPKLLMGTEYDVLSWWRVNSPKYPVLSEMARDVLAMQVSSVALESAFSNSQRILDPFRSALTHNSIEILMCTEQWLKCEIQLTEKGGITIQDLIADIEYQDKLQREFGM